MRIDKIDGWRFWSVFAVIVSHLLSHSQYYNTLGLKVHLEGVGLLGVEVFFFISGFVICTTLITELKTFSRISIKAFYIRRCFRILPPLWIYLLGISVAANYGLIEFNIQEAWIPALFISNLEFFPIHWFVGHTWSLSYEEQFYIVFPIIMWISYQSNKMIVFPLLIILFPVLSLLSYHLKLEIAAGFFRFFDFMLWGVVFAIYRDAIVKKVVLLGSVVPVFLFLTMVLISVIPADKFSTIFKVILLPPLVAISVTSTVFNYSALENFLSHKSVCYLGKISYNIYLWQQVATANYEKADVVFYLLAILGVIMYAIFQYEFIEKHMIKIGNIMSKKIIASVVNR